ncbi:MAG: SIMPL domain-containing protein [Patescibacteria group bacterium]
MNVQDRFWKVASLVGIVLVVFLAVLSIKGMQSLNDNEMPAYNSISVNGKGESVSIPDIATFSFGVTETAKTVAEAQSKATDRINAALKAVRDGGVEEKDIKTVSYSINPHYEYAGGDCNTYRCAPGKSTLTGYDVVQSVEVKIRNLEKAGAIFSTIGALNVENVNGLSFSIDDIEKVKAEARAKAIADAQAKAKDLAKQLGVKIVKITSFYDASDQPVFYGREGMGGDMLMNAKVSSAPTATPEIPTGEQKITSNVTITYEIK